MTSNLLETTRAEHEFVERTQFALLEEFEHAPKNYKESIAQTHRIVKYLDNIVEGRNKSVHIYEDADRARADDSRAIEGHGVDVFSRFYERSRDSKEFHRKNPGEAAVDPSDEVYLGDEVVPPFTGEEQYGRCIDLNDFYTRFSNLPEINKVVTEAASSKQKLLYVDYITRVFFQFDDDLSAKHGEYKQYVKDSYTYLISFIERSQPSFELKQYEASLTEDFETVWDHGNYRWNVDKIQVIPNLLPKPVEVKKEGETKRADDSREGTEEKTKEESDPLYCKFCKRSFAKQTVFDGHLKGKKHIQAEKKELGIVKIENRDSYKEVTSFEWKISEIAGNYLKEVIDETKVNIDKKQARSLDESMQDEEEEEGETMIQDEESDDEPEIKMTIEDYPVGWDGKPIPYWLYKLHGSGVKYSCEICGNAIYMGRKAYERHFQESRHAMGMRCLEIPNSKHFHDITKINDARASWEKIRRENSTATWKAEAEEEYEDKEGNVFNKKTFEDLKRQGLIKT